MNTLRLSIGTARHSEFTTVLVCSCQYLLYSAVHTTQHSQVTTVQLSIPAPLRCKQNIIFHCHNWWSS